MSRPLAFIQLMSALLDQTYLTEKVMLVPRHITPQCVVGGPDTLVTYELVGVVCRLIRIHILITAARLLFRYRPTLERFLSRDVAAPAF